MRGLIFKYDPPSFGYLRLVAKNGFKGHATFFNPFATKPRFGESV